jgi:hypothetical protein
MGALAEGCLEGLAQRGFVNGFIEHLLAGALTSPKVERIRLPRLLPTSSSTDGADLRARLRVGWCGAQPLVRSITCWTLSRYSEWICAPRRGQAAPP